MNWRSLALVAAMLILVTSNASAATTTPNYDLSVWSPNWQPSVSVVFNVTGLMNSTFSLTIVDSSGTILAGKQATLDKNGTFSWSWTPSSEGSLNATALFQNGLKITRHFLIQKVITQADLSNLYIAIAAERERALGAEIAALQDAFQSKEIAVFALVFAGAVFFYYRKKRPSPQESEFTRFLKNDVWSSVANLAKAEKKPAEPKKT